MCRKHANFSKVQFLAVYKTCVQSYFLFRAVKFLHKNGLFQVKQLLQTYKPVGVLFYNTRLYNTSS